MVVGGGEGTLVICALVTIAFKSIGNLLEAYYLRISNGSYVREPIVLLMTSIKYQDIFCSVGPRYDLGMCMIADVVRPVPTCFSNWNWIGIAIAIYSAIYSFM